MIVFIQHWLQQDYTCNPPRHIHNFSGLLWGKWAAGQVGFAVGKSLLNYLVAANGVVPHFEWHVFSVSNLIEIDVNRVFTEQLKHLL
ncbi:hypothetical protein ACFLW7_03195 [Chloroflexota bacterium]